MLQLTTAVLLLEPGALPVFPPPPNALLAAPDPLPLQGEHLVVAPLYSVTVLSLVHAALLVAPAEHVLALDGGAPLPAGTELARLEGAPPGADVVLLPGDALLPARFSRACIKPLGRALRVGRTSLPDGLRVAHV